MATPHMCPICNGTGHVTNGFYQSNGLEWVSSGTGFDQCRSCGGAGIVWDNELNWIDIVRQW